MKININFDPRIYNDVYFPLLRENTRIQIIFGGGGSGKSVFLSQRGVEDILKGGRNYLICRNTGNTIRKSVFNEVKKAINKSRDLQRLFKINKSEMTITCINGYQILFAGLDDIEKLKSITPEIGVITDIWIEEATEISYESFKGLEKRLRGTVDDGIKKRIILSFNPIYKSHWIYQQFFKGRFNDNDKSYKDDEIFILKTTYKDNKFLTEDDVKALENEQDEYYFNVYTMGNWGVLGGVIFTNWHTEDLSEIKNSFNAYRHGLDFGFTNDPTCYIKSAKKDNTIFLLDGFYDYGLDNPSIAQNILLLSPQCRNIETVNCDSSEPKSIKEIRDCGVNARSAIKGPGSVNYGIQFLKRHTIIIDSHLQEITNDFTLYQWFKNKNGEYTNTPVDKNNHAPDALRYAYGNEIRHRPEGKPFNPNEYGLVI